MGSHEVIEFTVTAATRDECLQRIGKTLFAFYGGPGPGLLDESYRISYRPNLILGSDDGGCVVDWEASCSWDISAWEHERFRGRR